jgi:hypothetical protein
LEVRGDYIEKAVEWCLRHGFAFDHVVSPAISATSPRTSFDYFFRAAIRAEFFDENRGDLKQVGSLVITDRGSCCIT